MEKSYVAKRFRCSRRPITRKLMTGGVIPNKPTYNVTLGYPNMAGSTLAKAILQALKEYKERYP